MYKVSIPEISKEELMERYKKIKPIVEIDGVKYSLREYTLEELKSISYRYSRYEDKRDVVDMDSLEYSEADDFECIHTFNYKAFFAPSVAEVLAQIDKQWQAFDYFEIIEYTQGPNDFRKYWVEFCNGFHVSKVRLYRKKNP